MKKINELYQAISKQHPESGSIHWTCRTWNLLIWQAIYVVVGVAQSASIVPSLENFGLHIKEYEVKGYSFSNQPLFTADQDEVIAFAGKQIQQFIHVLYEAFNQQYVFKRKLADKLCADCLNAALHYHNSLVTRYHQEEIETLAYKWLSACQLPIQASTITLPALNKLTQLSFGFNRQTCCQEFRIEKGILCDNCPKRTVTQRIQCMIEGVEYVKS
ncbi:hypothetical protein V757_08165 [Pelistega indica]|uniref:Ferric siderophore reductase C-terminal domain-containing protein n=1 Tax=Pelistega indica TaxID=1414851 RepID=V8G125_9BURK|nr:siderophore ferric iron reductase [Pelistega indica]ETD70219.1 hypothetical protein V757_08165 [Pelistega indica]